jgi:pyruvate/2-oxoglutarate dehydrogenase complex dihydrolipoamide dehydrogenase (E3) component
LPSFALYRIVEIGVGNDLLEGKHVRIATGAMPAALPFPGAEHLTQSEQFLELEALPPRLIFREASASSARISLVPMPKR